MAEPVSSGQIPRLDEPARPSRLSVSLTGEALSAVEDLAATHGVPPGEIVRRAIRLLKFMSDEIGKDTVFRMQPEGGEPERFHILYT